ncbi:MAG: site-specific integrase [Anaerolineales bacterium]|nr:site-specific integrase [Anaerolineales bacterium]
MQKREHPILFPDGMVHAQKDRRQRLGFFVEWREQTGYPWNAASILEAYERRLLAEGKLKPSSIRAHLATVRGRYRELLEDPAQLRQLLEGQGGNVSDKELELQVQKLDTLLNAEQRTREQRSQSAGYQPVPERHIHNLLLKPGVNTLKGLRDTAIFGLMIATGIREQEVCQLQVEDLELTSERGELCLHVPDKPGCQERLIPYRNMQEAVLKIVKAWLSRAEITEGYIFRGFVATTEKLRDNPIAHRSIQKILASYPIIEPGASPIKIKPMDLRRAYALRLFAENVPLEDIQDYLGLKTGEALMNYVGRVRPSSVSQRDVTEEWNHLFGTVLQRIEDTQWKKAQ